ncbi:uncharacterized protein LOC121255990, partial [Juglans microcarpa x Juglans regia]|uniref:uncharacterized protein LOC121255990 n=1 Tax=Juglans microcarpa x Juglans regia TaxID=2249226 RepID=UPI001B7EE717
SEPHSSIQISEPREIPHPSLARVASPSSAQRHPTTPSLCPANPATLLRLPSATTPEAWFFLSPRASVSHTPYLSLRLGSYFLSLGDSKPQLLVEAPKASNAIQFYKAAFGTEELGRTMHPKRKADQELPLILSTQLKLGGSTFLVSDLTDDSTAPCLVHCLGVGLPSLFR